MPGSTRIEVLPIGDVVDRVRQGVPAPATITVTASPSRGMEPTIEVASALAALGYRGVPHLSARLIRDEGHLRELLTRLRGAGVGEVFVVGGDAETPVGEFTSGAELLSPLESLAQDVRVGIPGYPEGHPRIPGPELERALALKAPRADYLVTQICFDARAIATWLARVRDLGITLPVYLGVPGPISPAKLLRISAKVGVGESLRVLRSHRGRGRLARRWDPTELVQQVGPAFADPAAGLAGLHIYSFNDVVAAARWRPGGGPT